jgi:hypothetical protein
MKSVKNVIDNDIVSPWRGSEMTAEMVRDQVKERWGDECAEEFDPETDAMPFKSWAAYGYRVKKGEKALKSVTYIEVKDEDGEVQKKVRRAINLFHRNQVEKI